VILSIANTFISWILMGLEILLDVADTALGGICSLAPDSLEKLEAQGEVRHPWLVRHD